LYSIKGDDMSSAHLNTDRVFYRTLSRVTLLCVAIVGLSACNDTKSSAANMGNCPEPRQTEFAPASVAAMSNPLPFGDSNISAGEDLFQGDAKPVSCKTCHGDEGAGDGQLASQFQPAPRNFTCKQTMHGITDGQMYWVIKNGSVGTSMPAFGKLSDKQIWQLVMYVRTFAPAVNNSQIVSKLGNKTR